jgi:hypothetical protein
MRKIILVSVIILLLAGTNVTAQKSSSFNSSSYTTALGIKLYPGSGGAAGTLKYFVKKNAALEALGFAWERGGRITGLYEFHWDIPNAPGLKWYAGPGAHIGFYNDKYYNDIRDGKGSYASIGLDGVIGLDYKFKNIPLNLSADWQPSFDFGNERYRGFGGNFGGIAARYTF